MRNSTQIARIRWSDAISSLRRNQLAEALVRIITDPALCKGYGACGRRIAETEFSWETVARQYLDLLEQVVASKKVESK